MVIKYISRGPVGFATTLEEELSCVIYQATQAQSTTGAAREAHAEAAMMSALACAQLLGLDVVARFGASFNNLNASATAISAAFNGLGVAHGNQGQGGGNG